MIDVLCPVLGRPQNAAPFIASLREATTVPWTAHFLCSSDDQAQIVACGEIALRDERVLCHICPWPAGRSDYARKMNYGYSLGQAEWMLLAADDISFRPGWDELALHHADRADVIGTNDLANSAVKAGRTSTHPLIRRRYVTEVGAAADGPGVLIHEGYDHNFTEREVVGLAQARGVWAFAKDSEIPHRHPLWRSAPWDDTYRKGQRFFRDDQRLFMSRAHLWRYKGLNPAERKMAQTIDGTLTTRRSRVRA